MSLDDIKQIPSVARSGVLRNEESASPRFINPDVLYFKAIQVISDALTRFQIATISKMKTLYCSWQWFSTTLLKQYSMGILLMVQFVWYCLALWRVQGAEYKGEFEISVQTHAEWSIYGAPYCKYGNGYSLQRSEFDELLSIETSTTSLLPLTKPVAYASMHSELLSLWRLELFARSFSNRCGMKGSFSQLAKAPST